MPLSTLLKKSAAFVIGIIISVFLIFFIYSQTLIVQMSNHSQRIINDLNDGANQAYSALAMLNQKNFTECSTFNLLTMRKLQFEANDIKDIGFFDGNKIICTTGVGELEIPISEGQFDKKIDGHEFWFGHKLKTFDGTVEGVVIKSGRYNVVLSFNTLLVKHHEFTNYEIVALINDQPKHLYGHDDIYKNETLNNRNNVQVGLISHKLEFCGEQRFICVAIQQDNFTEYQKVPFTLVLMFILILSGVTALHVYGYFDRYMNSDKRRIKKGLENFRFKPFYQPIVDLNTGKTVGCEMLARFKDSKGILYPDTFIPLVSELGASWQMTELLVTQAIDDLKGLELADNPIYLSINIFPKDINNGQVLKILDLIKETPSNIEFTFEITEDEELDFAKAQEILNKLVVAGVNISIDDFGTGYSNMSQLQSFPIHTLKIDKSFIDEVETGAIRSTLIPNIVSIANKLHAEIVAEGVENILQVEELLKMDITLAQGWHYSKALSIRKFKLYLADNSDFNLS